LAGEGHYFFLDKIVQKIKTEKSFPAQGLRLARFSVSPMLLFSLQLLRPLPKV